MRATTLIVIGLTVILYMVVQQIRSGVYVHKPLGIAIGSRSSAVGLLGASADYATTRTSSRVEGTFARLVR